MISRRSAIFHVASGVAAAGLLLRPSAAEAEQDYQRFSPLLVDLQGWQGGKPHGASMDLLGNNMGTIIATREYRRGSARLHADVLVGPEGLIGSAGWMLLAVSGLHIDVSEGRLSTSTIDGRQVTRIFSAKDDTGAIIVTLGARALFGIAFNKVTDDEALTLVKEFDWKAIEAASHAN
ncbi:MAG: hypothetical protein WBF58_19960 [Xanthobacteraceae bacterium]